MERGHSRTARRTGVVINYLGLIGLVVVFNLVEVYGVGLAGIIGLALTLAAVIVSFIHAYIRTGLWRLVHARTEKLDEREVKLTHEALGFSYSGFSVICLLAFYFELLVIKASIGALEIACLIYLAHILPSSYIAWREQEI